MNNTLLFIILVILILIYLWTQYKKEMKEGFDVANDPDIVAKMEKDIEEIKKNKPSLKALGAINDYIRGYLEIVKTLNKKMTKVNSVSVSIKNSKWNLL